MAGYPYGPPYNYPYHPIQNLQQGIAEGYVPNHQLLHSTSSDSLYGGYTSYDDGSQVILPAQAGQVRIRRGRNANNSNEHVKHRRTRSGCYTCRNRRVKCDEGHPTCERCRKGNRDCKYPEPAQTSKSGKHAKSKESAESPSSGEEDRQGDEYDTLTTIIDEDEDEDYDEPQSAVTVKHTLSPDSQTQSREASNPPSLTADKSPSPSTENSGQTPSRRPVPSRKQSRQALKHPGEAKTGVEITSDLRFYLDYYKNHITCHHYAMKYDAENFYTTSILEMTKKNAALLYAIVGFAAYHHTLTNPKGRLADFLKYYDESVRHLRISIEKKHKLSIATLWTILQLASIEEVLGDWGNLEGHVKAARGLITSLYTPERMQQTSILRKTLQWYVRFDLFLALQKATRPSLGNEWLVAQHEWFATQVTEHPDDIAILYEERFAYSRLLAGEYAILFDRDQSPDASPEEFGTKIANFMGKFARWPSELDDRLTDPKYLVEKFSGAPAFDTDVVDPYEPNILFGRERWVTNFLYIDIWAIELMFNLALSQVQGTLPDNPGLYQKAYKSAQLFEAIELYPEAPSGAIIDAQASFALGCLLLAKDERTTQWCCNKFATIETNGYIYPKGLRERMTHMWGRDVLYWWLPDGENCPPIMRELRDFTAERNSVSSADLDKLEGVFGNLRLNKTRKQGKELQAFGYDGASDSPEFTFGSEGSSERAFEDSPPLRWDYTHDDHTTPISSVPAIES